MSVAVMMGSASHRDKTAPAVKTLADLGVEVSERVLSTHPAGSVAAQTVAGLAVTDQDLAAKLDEYRAQWVPATPGGVI